MGSQYPNTQTATVKDIPLNLELSSKAEKKSINTEVNPSPGLFFLNSELIHHVPGAVDDLFTGVLINPLFQSRGEIWTRPQLLGISSKFSAITYEGFPIFHNIMTGRFPFLGTTEFYNVQIESFDISPSPFDLAGTLNISPITKPASILDLNLYRFAGTTSQKFGNHHFNATAMATQGNLYSDNVGISSVPAVYNLRLLWKYTGNSTSLKSIYFTGKNFYSGAIPRISNVPFRGTLSWDVEYAILGTAGSQKLGRHSSLDWAFSFNTFHLSGNGTRGNRPFNAAVRSGLFWSNVAYHVGNGPFSLEVGLDTVYMEKHSGHASLPVDAIASGNIDQNLPNAEISFSRRAAFFTGYVRGGLNNFHRTSLKAGLEALSVLPTNIVRISPGLSFSYSPAKWTELFGDASLNHAVPFDPYIIAVANTTPVVTSGSLAGGLRFKTLYFTLEGLYFYRQYSGIPSLSASVDISDPCAPTIILNTETHSKIRANGAAAVFYTVRGKHSLFASYYYGNTYRWEEEEGRIPLGYSHALKLMYLYKGRKWHLSTLLSLTSSRPYTPLASVGSVPDICTGTVIYYPIWGQENSGSIGRYWRLDAMVERLFHLKHATIVAYLDVFNVLFLRNLMGFSYSDDYSTRKEIRSLPPIPLMGIRAIF